MHCMAVKVYTNSININCDVLTLLPIVTEQDTTVLITLSLKSLPDLNEEHVITAVLWLWGKHCGGGQRRVMHVAQQLPRKLRVRKPHK